MPIPRSTIDGRAVSQHVTYGYGTNEPDAIADARREIERTGGKNYRIVDTRYLEAPECCRRWDNVLCFEVIYQ